MTILLTRRTLLLVAIPIVAIKTSNAASCAGDHGSDSIREAMNYKEASPDPAKVCRGCGFFTDAGDGCGTCTIFSGGGVNALGHCDSWSAKT